MIYLHKFGAAWGLPDLSPFCIKVETYLRMIGVPFQSVVAASRKAPKQKLPYVDDGGTIIDDSRDIIDHFEAKIPAPLDRGLSGQDRALAAAFRSLLETEVYFYAVHLRWQLNAGWQTYLPVLRQYAKRVGVPGLLAPLVLRSIRKQVIRDLWGQGAGRYTEPQVETRLCAALSALSTQLGDKRYFLGAEPRTIDATVHAFLWALLDGPFDSSARNYARAVENLPAYCARMRDDFFAETGAQRLAVSPLAVGSAA